MEINLRRLMRTALPFTIAIAAVCCAPLNAWAQNVTSATLSGVVEDTNGASVPGATLTATNIDTNQQRTIDSDREGRFKFTYLPVGSYKLTVAETGFRMAARDVTLTVGQALFIVLKLDVNSVAENVTVTD